MAEQGISTGTSPGVYSPDAVVTRGQMALFLHRATGLIDAGTPHSFSDITAEASYEDAVSWLVEAGITAGTAPGIYSPEGDVTRGQMATFLHRRGCGISMAAVS